MTKTDNMFQQLLKNIMENGVWSENARPRYKNGKVANSKYVTNQFMEWDLDKGEFPITTLRPIAWKTAIREIYQFYNEQSNKVVDFEKNKIGYWSDWVVNPDAPKEEQHIGQTYGYVVKKHNITDRLLKGLEKNPWNRRNIVSLWDYESFDEDPDALLPCAWNFMVDVRKVDGQMYLDGHLSMRSNDTIVAQHMDTIQYVALQMMIAKHFGWKVGKFTFFIMNAHVYDNQFEQVNELLSRTGQSTEPRLVLNVPDGTPFYDIKPEDFEMVDYNPVKPQLKFDLAI